MQIEKILGVKVNFGLTKKSLLVRIHGFLNSKDKHYICTTNPEFIVDAQNDEAFRDVINQSSLSIPDGVGLLYIRELLSKIEIMDSKEITYFKLVAMYLQIVISHMKKKDLYSKRLTGVDLVKDLAKFCEKKKYNLILLGGWPQNFMGKKKNVNYDLATKAANVLKQNHPDLRIPGASSQYSYKEKDDASSVDFVNKCVSKSEYDTKTVLLVAYGHKKQELWIKRNLHNLDVNLAIGVGGTFDYISGNVKRAPRVFINMNLEWLFRLLVNPWRFKRIFKAAVIFPHRFMQQIVITHRN